MRVIVMFIFLAAAGADKQRVITVKGGHLLWGYVHASLESIVEGSLAAPAGQDLCLHHIFGTIYERSISVEKII